MIMERNPSEGSQSHKVLIQAETLRQRLQEVATQINSDYVGREIDLVCLTNAAMTITADMMRLLQVPARLHALAFTSYSSAPISGEVRLTLDITEPLNGRHVLVMEGMVISGRTPLYLLNLLRLRQPASLELCVIGSKPSELAVDLPIKYRLYEFGNEWVAGYGIGHGAEKALPHLVNLKP
jgi:hypoxanthine phosphoribosyltransferase